MEIGTYTAHFSADRARILYLMDKVRLAEKTHGTVYTDFLTPEETAVLKQICYDAHVLLVFSDEITNAERTIGAIYLYERDGDFPCQILKISCNPKFEKLEHRDYLGAVLALGIKREKIGDINVFEGGAEIYVHSDICDYVAAGLDKVRHTGIKSEVIHRDQGRVRQLEFKEMKIIVTSMRLDCVVAALINQSRAKAADSIKSSEVKLNYSVALETNCKVDTKDLVSIKGHGRFVIDERIGLTKSDRITLLIKKYL